MLIPGLALACGDSDSPEIYLEPDTLSAAKDYCGYYVFVVPSEHKGEDIDGIILKHGKGGNELRFNLSIGRHPEKESLSTGVVCSNPAWLSEAELSLTYKPRPIDNGAFLSCISSYQYPNLGHYIEERKRHNKTSNPTP